MRELRIHGSVCSKFLQHQLRLPWMSLKNGTSSPFTASGGVSQKLRQDSQPQVWWQSKEGNCEAINPPASTSKTRT